MEYKTVA